MIITVYIHLILINEIYNISLTTTGSRSCPRATGLGHRNQNFMITYTLHKLSTHNKPHLNQRDFGHWN